MARKILRQFTVAKLVEQVIKELIQEVYVPVSVRPDGATFNLRKVNGSLDARVAKAGEN